MISSGVDVQVPLLLKKGAASFVQSASTDPFTIEWYMKMTDNADLNKDIESHFTLKDPRFHSTPTLLDFAIVYEAFYKHHKVGWLHMCHGNYLRTPMATKSHIDLKLCYRNAVQ